VLAVGAVLNELQTMTMGLPGPVADKHRLVRRMLRPVVLMVAVEV
jgi:hypothetical protein